MSDDEEHDAEKYLTIPYREISAEALNGLIETFVLREGTDYGAREFNLHEKVEHVYRQLECGYVGIVYNVELQSADMLTRTEIERLSRQLAIET